jgi:phage shock protein C
VNPEPNRQWTPPAAPRRLYRSADDRMISGVAGGMAEYFDMDPALVRVLWVISFIVTASATFWVYVVMMLVVPMQSNDWPPESAWNPGGPGVPNGSAGYWAGFAPPQTDSASGPSAPAGPDATQPGSSDAIPPVDADTAMPGGSSETASGGSGASPFSTSPASASGWWSNDWQSQRRQARWQRKMERWQRRADERNYHSYGGPGLFFGLMLVIVGGLLAWHQFDPGFHLDLAGPIAIIAFGSILVASAFRFRNN